jgi:Leucine-rich repeat (LRR) protein
MTGLEGVKNLQILNMADNKLIVIENPKDLSNLKKLDLGNLFLIL